MAQDGYNFYTDNRGFSPSQDEWCLTCKWANIIDSNHVYCPFVKGSCARIPYTINYPASWLETIDDYREEYIRVREVMEQYRRLLNLLAGEAESVSETEAGTDSGEV